MSTTRRLAGYSLVATLILASLGATWAQADLGPKGNFLSAVAEASSATPEQLYELMKTDFNRQIFGANVVEWGVDPSGKFLRIGVENLSAVPTSAIAALGDRAEFYPANRPMRYEPRQP